MAILGRYPRRAPTARNPNVFPYIPNKRRSWYEPKKRNGEREDERGREKRKRKRKIKIKRKKRRGANLLEFLDQYIINIDWIVQQELFIYLLKMIIILILRIIRRLLQWLWSSSDREDSLSMGLPCNHRRVVYVRMERRDGFYPLPYR